MVKINDSDYLVFVDDRGRYHADLKNAKSGVESLVVDSRFDQIFKNQNQELNGQDSYGFLYVPVETHSQFKVEYEILESNLKKALGKPLTVELKSKDVLNSIKMKSKSGLFLKKPLVLFYSGLIELIQKHDAYFRISRLDWVNVFIVNRFSYFLNSKQLTMRGLRAIVKYMYQYASFDLKAELFSFDIKNKDFLDALLQDIDTQSSQGDVEKSPYADARVSWLKDLWNVVSNLSFENNYNDFGPSFNNSYDDFESDFLASEIEFFAKNDTIHRVGQYSVFVDDEISLDGSEVLDSKDDMAFGIRIIDFLLGYLNKSLMALMGNLHNDYSKSMSLPVQSIPDSFWFTNYDKKYKGYQGMILDADMCGIFFYFRHVMANSVDTLDENKILNVYSDNYEILMAYISFYLETVSYFGNKLAYDYEHSISLEQGFQMCRLFLVNQSEALLENKDAIIPKFVL